MHCKTKTERHNCDVMMMLCVVMQQHLDCLTAPIEMRLEVLVMKIQSASVDRGCHCNAADVHLLLLHHRHCFRASYISLLSSHFSWQRKALLCELCFSLSRDTLLSPLQSCPCLHCLGCSANFTTLPTQRSLTRRMRLFWHFLAPLSLPLKRVGLNEKGSPFLL